MIPIAEIGYLTVCPGRLERMDTNEDMSTV